MALQYFSGKVDSIRGLFTNARRILGLIPDARGYFNRRPHNYHRDEDNWPHAITPFTDALSNNRIARLAVSENVLLIGNQSSFSMSQYPEHPATAGMSMVHIFAISTANFFNPVTMEAGDEVIINEMIEFFRSQWGLRPFREAVLLHQWNAIQRRGRESGVGLQQAIDQYYELEATIHELTIDDFAFGFHLYPENTVAHLHMHIVAMRDEFRRYSTREHDEKTKDALEVRDQIRRMDG